MVAVNEAGEKKPNLRSYLTNYAQLLRLDKPIGILLLLWPTLWALWLANDGMPDFKILFIFVFGTVVMRSLGCVLNDIADRHIDIAVERTKSRPIAAGLVSVQEAVIIAGILAVLAFGLVLFCNRLTVLLAFCGLILAAIYPYLKRVTHLPQLGLGLAFSWGVPMAFAASLDQVPARAWFLFFTAMLWPMIYDTMYAMVDRPDDMRIGVKSTAILFGKYDKLIIGILQAVFILLMSVVGIIFHLDYAYQFCLFIPAILFLYQQWLIKDRNRLDCFHAFKNNHSVGLMIFVAILWGQMS